MEILLRYKAYQIFLLTFGIYLFFQIFRVLHLYFFTDWIWSIVAFGTSVALACWTYIAGIKLSEKRPYDDNNEGLFRKSIIAIVIIDFSQDIMFPIMDFNNIPTFYSLIVVSFCIHIYCIYFVAKVLTSVEQGRETSFRDFVGDFFLFFFQPIGVWWLQPRINNIFDKEIDPSSDAPLDQHMRL